MAIEHIEGVGTIYDGADTLVYRRQMIKRGMEAEHLHGMRLTRKAPSCFTIVKREEGFKGNHVKLYKQFCEKYGLEMNPKMLEPPKAE